MSTGRLHQHADATARMNMFLEYARRNEHSRPSDNERSLAARPISPGVDTSESAIISAMSEMHRE